MVMAHSSSLATSSETTLSINQKHKNTFDFPLQGIVDFGIAGGESQGGELW